MQPKSQELPRKIVICEADFAKLLAEGRVRVDPGYNASFVPGDLITVIVNGDDNKEEFETVFRGYSNDYLILDLAASNTGVFEILRDIEALVEKLKGHALGITGRAYSRHVFTNGLMAEAKSRRLKEKMSGLFQDLVSNHSITGEDLENLGEALVEVREYSNDKSKYLQAVLKEMFGKGATDVE